jgi:membrane fusion protein, multidrug efflux system
MKDVDNTAGRCNARRGLAITAVVLSAGAAGCTGDAHSQGGAPQAAPVDTIAAVTVRWADTEEFTGRLEALDVVEVRPRIRGAIDAVHVVDGANVQRGSRLFSVDARPYQAALARAEGELAGAAADEKLAASELQRAEVLLPQRAISTQEVDQLRARVQTTRAAVMQSQAALRAARLDLEYTDIRAPVAGRVSRIEVKRGNLVDDQRVLTTLVGASTLHAYFDVSEETFLRLRKQPDVNRTVKMGLADEPELPHDGRVDFIDSRLNPQTGTMRLRATFGNADGTLVPGLFARIRVQSSAERPVLVAPERAIATDQDRKFVWIVGADNLAQPRPVTLGGQAGGVRVLRSGVQEGERIVVGGLQRVRPGAPVAPNELKTDERGLPLPPPPAASGAATRNERS